MKAALALLAAAPLVLAEPAQREPQDSAPQLGEADQPVCRDRIEQVREERGLPRLDRQTATPDQPYFIAAVDHRIDGCSVMVMRQNTRDIRPIPKPDERAPLLRPAQ